MEVLLIGLGKMGGNMARRLLRKGHTVIGYNRSSEITHQLEKEEGLAKPLERATKLAISIGSPYYEGQTLSLTIPAEPGTTFRWTLNGQIIQEGLNANSLSYTFAKAGEYTLTVAELHNGQVVAEATDTTVVKALPAPK